MQVNSQTNILTSILKPLTLEIAQEISQWEYEAPYDAYSFKGTSDAYLLDEATWGTEQFYLDCGGTVIGQAACQYEGNGLWVGWSMAPELCGNGNGAAFVKKCVSELRRVKNHQGRVLLRVSARNRRAIRAYEKAGFSYVKTIQDEIAYTDNIEDFWVMEQKT